MRQRVFIALLTIVMLGIGFAAGLWTERHSCKIPAPPPLLGELAGKKPAASALALPPPDASGLATQVEQLRPQIEHFRAQVQALDEELDRNLLGILTPEQKVMYGRVLAHRAERRARDEAINQNPLPLSAEEINELKQKPLYKLLAVVVIPLRLEWLANDVKLTDAQREQARAILVERREKFLQLIDSSPPPSLELSRLALAAQRLNEAAAAQAAEAKK